MSMVNLQRHPFTCLREHTQSQEDIMVGGVGKGCDGKGRRSVSFEFCEFISR